MQEIDKIIHAWKDDDYLMSLSADERRALPENPAGLIEFSGVYLNQANGNPRPTCSGVMILGMCVSSFF
jgi:mersacidin/lichenicidin family type 2 lantibiotic